MKMSDAIECARSQPAEGFRDGACSHGGTYRQDAYNNGTVGHRLGDDLGDSEQLRYMAHAGQIDQIPGSCMRGLKQKDSDMDEQGS